MSKTLAPVKGKTLDLSVEYPDLTVANVRKGIDVTDTLDRLFTAQRTVQGAGEALMYPLALATFAAHEAGLIGKGDGARWATQADYAAAGSMSPAYASRLSLIGRAVVVHGVRKGSKEYAALTMSATYSRVKGLSAAIRGTDTDAVTRFLKEAITPAPAAVESSDASPNRTPGGTTDQTEQEDTRPPAPPTVGDVRDLLRQVETLTHSLTPGDSVKVERALLKMAASLADRRKTLADTVAGEVVAG